MVIPHWLINPYDDIEETGVVLQNELIGISTNEELKVQLKNGYQKSRLQKDIPLTYPILYNIARKFLIAFSSSYLMERGFNAVDNLLTKEKKLTGHY
ncbi:SCAN domain-containing protein 3 [Trichonephila clavipes]|nr:SCAN domain-containing protein 3 [Trichonephila clavipes]